MSRWVCPRCQANNMPQVGACFQCGAPQPVPVVAPTLSIPDRTVASASATPAGRSWQRHAATAALVFLVGFAGLLALNNPPREDYNRWLAAELEKQGPDQPPQAFGLALRSSPLFLGLELMERTRATNCGLFTLFETRNPKGQTVCRVLGIFQQFHPFTPIQRDTILPPEPAEPPPLQVAPSALPGGAPEPPAPAPPSSPPPSSPNRGWAFDAAAPGGPAGNPGTPPVRRF